MKYKFSPNVSEKNIKFVKIIDKISLFFKKRTNVKSVDINKIAIVQLAHIGDLILLLPAIKKLKVANTYKIILVVSSQNYLIASRLKFVDEVVVVDAPYFSRNKKISYWKFISQLRKIKTDLIFDVRADLRNNFFINFFTKAKLFIGYGVGGGAAFLDIVLEFKHGGHTSDLFDPLFEYLKLPQTSLADFWDTNDIPYDNVDDIDFPEKFMVVHLGTGAQSKKWPIQNFVQTIKAISDSIPVFVLGIKQDATDDDLEEISRIKNVTNCVGKYSILQSIYILKRCSCFLGLDSGFSQIAGLLKKKTFVLFSGTTDVNIWKPYSFYEGQVLLINHDVPCNHITGCGKQICGDNICMKLINPIEVISLIKANVSIVSI